MHNQTTLDVDAYGDKVGATDFINYYSADGAAYTAVDQHTGEVKRYRRISGYTARDSSPHDDLLLLVGDGEPLLCQCVSGHIVSEMVAREVELSGAEAKWLTKALREAK